MFHSFQWTYSLHILLYNPVWKVSIYHLYFQRMRKQIHKGWASRSSQVHGQAAPGAWTLQLLATSMAKQSHWPRVSAHCSGAAFIFWFCRWVAMSLTPFWLHLGPFLSSFNYFMHFLHRGAESSKEEKESPPFPSIRELTLIWQRNAHQGLTTLLRGRRWKLVTH